MKEWPTMKERVAVRHLNLCSGEAHLLSVTTNEGTLVYELTFDQVVLLAYQAVKIIWTSCPPSLS
jgi:hypothetical protein